MYMYATFYLTVCTGDFTEIPCKQGFKIELPHDKTNKVTVRPVKTQVSLGIHPVWSASLLGAQWVAKDPSVLHAYSEDSDQTRHPGWSESLLSAYAILFLNIAFRSRLPDYFSMFFKPDDNSGSLEILSGIDKKDTQW